MDGLYPPLAEGPSSLCLGTAAQHLRHTVPGLSPPGPNSLLLGPWAFSARPFFQALSPLSEMSLSSFSSFTLAWALSSGRGPFLSETFPDLCAGPLRSMCLSCDFAFVLTRNLLDKPANLPSLGGQGLQAVASAGPGSVPGLRCASPNTATCFMKTCKPGRQGRLQSDVMQSRERHPALFRSRCGLAHREERDVSTRR